MGIERRRAGAVGWLNTKKFDETGDAAKSQGWTRAHRRHQRQRQARRLRRAQPAGRSRQGQAHRPGVLRGDAEPGRRHGLGHAASAVPGAIVRVDSRPRSAGRRRSRKSTMCRCPASARAAATSTARASCGCRSRSGHLGSFDRRKCKGPLNGPDGHRQSMSGRLVVLPISGPGLCRHRREQRRVELLHLGRPAQHARPRQRRAGLDRQPQRRPASRSRTAR